MHAAFFRYWKRKYSKKFNDSIRQLFINEVGHVSSSRFQVFDLIASYMPPLPFRENQHYVSPHCLAHFHPKLCV